MYSISLIIKCILVSVSLTSSLLCIHFQIRSYPLGGSDDKESAYNAGDPGLIPVLERYPGKGMDTHSNILAWRIP